MKILDTEIEFSFTDAENMEKLEKAIETTKNKINKIDTKGTTSQVIRKTYELIKECFDSVFGEGKTEEIMNNKIDFKLCIKAFKDLVDAKIEQENELDENMKELEEISTIYSPNRAARRKK